MATRFCQNCGAKLLGDANFCVECGDRVPGSKAPRAMAARSVQRYAPAVVVLTVVAVGAAAIFLGMQAPKTPPPVPGRGAPPAAAAPGAGNAAGTLPEGHPPLAIPDEVKQVIRDMAAKATAAPDDLDTWKRLAEMQYRAGQLDPTYLPQATASYRHVLEREPGNLDAVRNLGNIAFDQDQPDVAMDFYRRYLQQKPDDLNVQTDLGTMYLAAGKTQEALQQYEQVLKANPSFFQAQLNLGIAYRSLGETEKAVAALEKSRPLAPDDRARSQVDQLLARAKGQPPPAAPPPPAAAPMPAAAAAPAAPAATFQADAEAIFRQNPIMGPKVQRIEWPEPEAAKVYLRDFPMDQMGEDMRNMFLDRMKGRIKEKKAAHQVTQAARFDLVDAASGKVMGSIVE